MVFNAVRHRPQVGFFELCYGREETGSGSAEGLLHDLVGLRRALVRQAIGAFTPGRGEDLRKARVRARRRNRSRVEQPEDGKTPENRQLSCVMQ